MLRGIKNLAIAVALVSAASAKAGEGDFKISSWFDMNYTHNFNDVSGGATNTNVQNNSVQDDFNVQQAEIALSGAVKNLNYFVSFDLGGHSAITTGKYISEAYLTHNFSDKLALTFGRMYGNVGFESNRSKDNWLYSRSIGAQNTPLWHEGVAVNYNMGNGLTFGGFIYDEADNFGADALGTSTINEDDKHKAYSVQVGYTMDKISATYNYFTTKDQDVATAADGQEYSIHNINAKYSHSKELAFAVAYLMANDKDGAGTKDEEWSSLALYANYMLCERTTLSGRYEMFEQDGTTENEISSISVAASYDLLNNSKLKFEYRMDKSDDKIYADNGANKADDQNVATVAWIFSI